MLSFAGGRNMGLAVVEHVPIIYNTLNLTSSIMGKRKNKRKKKKN
jgi:hypothetical protein